jgi:hypothetical protein
MPKVRAFQASQERGAFAQLTLIIDRHTYEVLAGDARDERVSVEQFTPAHLANALPLPQEHPAENRPF